MSAAAPHNSRLDLDAWGRFKEWAPVLLLAFLFLLSYRGLLEFTAISPLNESPDGVIDGELFIPNQKSPVVFFSLAAFFLASRFARLRSHIGAEPASPISVPLFVIALVIGVWSHYTGELALDVLSLSLILLATAALLGGLPAFRVMCLPALFLLLAVPIPGVLLNSLIYPLQLSTAAASGMLLSLLGIENLVSGEMIYTSRAVFQVIESCSGLRTMETMVMTAFVYQELVPHSRVYSWILVLTAPLLGAIVNQLRVLAIILNPFAPLSEDHTIQGIAMIIVGTLMIAGLGAVLARWLPAKDPAPEAGGESVHPAAEWPLRRLAVVSMLLMTSVAATQGARWEVERPEHRNPVRLPAQYEGWQAEVNQIDREFMGSTHHTQAILRTYRRGGDEVSVFLAVDARRRPLLSGISPKNGSLGPGWHTLWRRPLSLGTPGVMLATVSVQQKLDQLAYVISWRQGTDSYLGEMLRNAVGLDRSPWQRPYNATAVRISTPLRDRGAVHEDRAHKRIEPLIDLVLQNFPPPHDHPHD